jgi:hypothetical protein
MNKVQISVLFLMQYRYNFVVFDRYSFQYEKINGQGTALRQHCKAYSATDR